LSRRLKSRKKIKQLADESSNMIEEYLERREKEIRILFEKMMSKSSVLIENWKE